MNIPKELKAHLISVCIANGLQTSDQYDMINNEESKLDEQKIAEYVAEFASRVDTAIRSHLKEIHHNRNNDGGYIIMEVTTNDYKFIDYILVTLSEFFFCEFFGCTLISNTQSLRIYWDKEKGRDARIKDIQRKIRDKSYDISRCQSMLNKKNKKMASLGYKLFNNNPFWRSYLHEGNLNVINNITTRLIEYQKELDALNKQLTLV